MFTRDPSLVKKFYLAANKPSQFKWNDFFDFMASIQSDIAAAYELLIRPVSIVLDEAGLLAVGPSLLVGQRAKRLDNGVTYVKQVETGSLLTDWVAIGDTYITIPDVTNLQSELDLRLRSDIDDSTPYRLGMGAEWHTSPCVDVIPDVQPTQDVLPLPFWVMNKYFSHLTNDRDFTITVDHGTSMPVLPGLVLHLLVRNNSLSASVQFEEPADLPDTGDGVARFVPLNMTYPVTVNPGGALWITVLQLPIPVEDPDYASGNYYFVSVQEMSEPVIPIPELEIGTLSSVFYSGEYYPPTEENHTGVGLALIDSLYEEAIAFETLASESSVGMEMTTSTYEEVIIINPTLNASAGVGMALIASSYPAVIQTVGPFTEDVTADAAFSGGVYRDSAESPGLKTEDVIIDAAFSGGTYA